MYSIDRFQRLITVIGALFLLLLFLFVHVSTVCALQLTVLVQPMTSTAGELLTLQPVVALTDDNGNIITSVNTGTVRASIGVNPAVYATVQGTTTAFTFVNGIAKCSGLYINQAGVGYTLLLISMDHGVRTETSAFDVVVGARYTIAIIADISTAYGGTPFLPQPAVAIVDKGGNIVTATNQGTVRLEIIKNPVDGKLFPPGNLNVTIGAGIAKFQGVYIDVAGSPYTLRYTTDLLLNGGSTVETNPFTVAAGVCDSLVLLSSPVEATGGKAFGIQPVLKLVDAGGNTLEEDSSSLIRVAISSNPSSGTLKPIENLHGYVRKGIAIFRSLEIDKAGNDYSLTFRLYVKVAGKTEWTETEIELISTPFNVLVGLPVSLYLQQNISDGVRDGQPNDYQPIVVLLDSGGNVVSNIMSGSITASLIPSASIASSIIVDTSGAPLLNIISVRAVPSSLYPMPYGAGFLLSVEVVFTDEVFVTGLFTLELKSSSTGGPNGMAECVTLNTWTNTLTFQYSVVQTDDATDLNYASTTSLSASRGTIVDRNGKLPVLTLPALDNALSLAGTSGIMIDTSTPMIVNVTCSVPGNGEYGSGEEIYLRVMFSKPVTVYGDPFLPVKLTTIGNGAATRNAVFASGNNTNTLVFLYVVQNGDATSKLDVITNVNVNGGYIKHYSTRPTTDANLAMCIAPNNLASLNTIVIDTAVPVVDTTVGVTSTSSSGTYTPGDTIQIAVTFTKAVRVIGYPRLYLETGTIKRPAEYKSGDGTKVLTFTYTVSAYDSHNAFGRLNYRDDNAIDLNGGSIKRLIQHGIPSTDADLSLQATTLAQKSLMDNTVIYLDGQPATVQAVSVLSTPSNNVVRDDVVILSISFTSRVSVNTTLGIPSLLLAVGEYNRQAVYTAGSETRALSFTYVVSLGDKAPEGLNYSSINALVLNGGTIRKASMNPTMDAILTLPSPALGIADPPVVVDPTFQHTTTAVTLNADVSAGEYGSHEVISITVTFTDEVAVDGQPKLKLTTNTLVSYISGSGTASLLFVYIVQDGDQTTNLDKFDDNAIICSRPLCVMINYNGQDVSTSLHGISMSPQNIAINTVPPTVVSVYSITSAPQVNDNTFVVGDEIDIIVAMSLEVFIDPPPSVHKEKAPLLILNIGLYGRSVLCQGYFQEDRTLLHFKYIVEEGDYATDLTYVDEESLTLNNGQCSIKRFSTTPTTDALLTLPKPSPLGAVTNQVLKLDTSKIPSVISVTSSMPDGLFRCGDSIELTIDFTQHVVVVGTPFLWLDLGPNSRKAYFVSGNNTKTLSFIYTVQEDDYSTDLEYVDHHSLDASDVTAAILHLSTNPTTLANLDLPYLFTQGSLGFNKNLMVDGRKPSIIATKFLSPDGVYQVNQKIVMEVTFSSCVVVDMGTNNNKIPMLRFEPNSATSSITRYGVYVSGSPGTKLRFEYTIQTGDTATKLDYASADAIVLNDAKILTCTTTAGAAPTQLVNLHLNPPGGQLMGATTKPITFGKATFTDLLVNRLGFNYEIFFQTQYNNANLKTSSTFNVLYSAVYGLRSSPYVSGDQIGASVAVDGDTLVLGGPGAQEPVSAVQIVSAVGDAEEYVDEIQTISTSATQRPAIQELTSSAAPGETVGGWFYLQIGFIGPTRRIYSNFDATQLRVALELDLGFGLETIRVTREDNTFCACNNAYIWTITFLYVEGPLALLTATSMLTEGSVSTRMLVESTSISGFFTLQYGGLVTRNIKSYVSENELSTILTQDLKLPIRRIIQSSPSPVGGYTWSVTFVASDQLYDVAQLMPQYVGLLGYQAKATVRTEREGCGRLSGFFRLRFRPDLFPNDETDNISVTASDHDVETALEKLVSINDVAVTRSTSMNIYGGYSWTITFVQVNTKNEYGPIVDTSGNLPALVAVTSTTTVTGTTSIFLKGTNARISVQVGGYGLSSLEDGETRWGLPGENAGMAAVFIREDNDWKQQGGTLTGSDTRTGDLFGSSVKVKGDRALVGAPAAAIFGDFEQQNLFCDADGGYFRLIYMGKPSIPVPFNADTDTLHKAIVNMMSVAHSDVRIDTPFSNVCTGREIAIILEAGDHADSNGDIPDIKVDASGLLKGSLPGTALMQEYKAGTFRQDGVGSKGLQCGAAYIFVRNNGVWSQQTKLTPPSSQIFDVREYGAQVALHDTFAVVGAPGSFADQGRVFVYQYNTGTSIWSLFQVLSTAPKDASSGDRFGDAVVISGNVLAGITIVVGAPGYYSESGAVFVFDLLDGRFQQRQFILQATPELTGGDHFGCSLDLDLVTTYTLVVGADQNSYRSGVNSGLAVVFTRRSATDAFFLVQQVLFGSDTRARDWFGRTVAVSKDTIIVGAHERFEGKRTIRKAVQSITTSTTSSSVVITGGTFVLSYKVAEKSMPNQLTRIQTQPIAYNINPASLKVLLESDLTLGEILVRREGPSANNGYTWYLTFASSTSELPLLEANGKKLLASGGGSAQISMKWVIRVPPILRGNAYVFTRNSAGSWTEQATLFPRKKQYFAWFGSAVALDRRTAIIGTPNLDTYETGINSGGGFVYDLGIFALEFSSKSYSVLEGSDLEVTVQRCSYNNGFCAMEVATSLKQYINFDTGDAFSDRCSQNCVSVIPQIGPYQKLSQLEAAPFSSNAFFANDVIGQEPFPQVARGRWLSANSVGTANGRNQYYGSSDRRSLWIDSRFDYAGESDYASSSGVLFFDSSDVSKTFKVSTTDDFVVEDPDETIMLRLSLPGIWPSNGGSLWSTITITDNGDGGSGARSYLDILSAGENAQANSQFSSAVSIYSDGNVAIVGAPLEKQTIANQANSVACGAAYLFEQKSGIWQLNTKVFPSDCSAGMKFGASVSIDGSYGTIRALVGAPGAAAAYVYQRQGTRWIQDVRLTHAEASSPTHNFGGVKAVDLYGDVAVIGAAGVESVFVYHRTLQGWEFAARLFCSDRVVSKILEEFKEQEYHFGHAVALHRRTIVIGAPFADKGAFSPNEYHDPSFDRHYFGMGAAYTFYIQAQVQSIQLRADMPLTSGTFCLSTAYRSLTTSTTRQIAFSASPAEMKAAIQDLPTIKLVETARTGTVDQGFTWLITFISEIISVPLLVPTWKGWDCGDCDPLNSAYITDPANQILVTEVTPFGQWQEQARLVAPDGNPGDQFGSSVAISGEQVIIGAPFSSALTTTTWNFETGDLTGWLTTGTAFDMQPTYGDNSYARINKYHFRPYTVEQAGERSHLEGRYWVGTFEARAGAGKTAATISTCAFANDQLCKVSNYQLPGANPAGTYYGDSLQGTMTSQAFTILGPWLSFKIGGGCDIRLIYVELLVDGVATLRATGRCEETMDIVQWDLTPFQNRTAQLRVVDKSDSDFWGHINFDDVRFSWKDTAQASTVKAGVAYTFRRHAPNSLDPCTNMDRKLCEWRFQSRLISSDKRDEDLFGFDVAIDDSTGLAVISAPGQRAFDANNSLVLDPETGAPMEAVGSVYVFQRADEVRDGKGALVSPMKWTPKEVVKLQYPKKQPESEFGYAIAMDQYALIVGARWLSTSPVNLHVGLAFAYDISLSTVKFTSNLFFCVEGNAAGHVSLTISRTMSNLTLPLTVGYATEDLSARGVDTAKYTVCQTLPATQRSDCGDYQQIAGEVTFATGETSKQLMIPIVDDTCNEQYDEYFTVRLHVPGGEPLIGEQFVARVRIDDDDYMYEPC